MRGRDRLVAASEWRLLGLLFERPRAGWLSELRSLAAPGIGERLVESVAGAANATEGDYLAALGPGGLTSPREIAYLPMADPGKVLADLAVRYDAFGYRPRSEDPDDHVAIEVGFVAYLLMKEAYALEAGQDEQAEICRGAREEMLVDHLTTLSGGLLRGLTGSSSTHLSIAATELVSRCPRDRNAASSLSVIGSTLPEDEPFGCGDCQS